MLTSIPQKVILVALLIGAATINLGMRQNIPPWPGLKPGIVLGFGLLNVFLSYASKTSFVAVVLAAITLLSRNSFGLFFLGFVLFIWPTAILLEVLNRDYFSNFREGVAGNGPRAQRLTFGLVIGTAIAALAYRTLRHQQLQQTAVLFVGIPVLLSTVVIFLVRPQSAVGVACKAVTIGLLLSMVLLWEGVLCIVMAAPLFYAVGMVIGGTYDAMSRNQTDGHVIFSFAALLVLVPMSVEGVTDHFSFNRNEAVVRTHNVDTPAADVGRALDRPPRFDRPLPLFLRAGFPRPTASRINRSSGSVQWIITMTGGEIYLNGMEPRAGELTLTVEETRPGYIRFRVAGDTSHVTHYLDWREAEVRWVPLTADTTQVTWTLRYRRGLDPMWYFGPLERYAVGLAADYLIQSMATP